MELDCRPRGDAPRICLLRRRCGVVFVRLLVLAVVLTTGGCGGTSDSGRPNGDDGDAPGVVTSGEALGKKLLVEMAQAYRNAAAYRDQATLRLEIRSPTGPAETETYPFAVEFVRPDKIRIEAYSATVASDGRTVIGKVALSESNNFDGQVVELDAPARLTSEAIAAVDQALAGGISGATAMPFQLGLLLTDRLDEEFQNAQRVAVLPSKQLDGRDCHCVQIEDDAGRSVWWIDKQDHMLRRFEYPVEEIARQFRRNPSEISLVADFTGAAFAAPDENRFTLAVADDAQRVKYLVPPPALPPDKLVGEPSPAFAFDEFSGQDFAQKTAGKLTPDSLRGKSAMLLFWTNQDAAVLDAFEELAQRYQDRPELAFVAVLTETSDAVSDAQLRKAMSERKPAFTVARADNATAAFGLLAPSAVVFLGSDGVVEDVFLLDTYSAVQGAAEILDTLLAGKPWHPRALGRFEEFRRQYAEQLVLAKTGRVPTVQAAPQAPPQNHRLVSLWKTTELKQPGNIVASPLAAAGLLVLDGARSVVEVDAGGKLGARHDLKLPDGGDVGFLRSGHTRDGKTFFVGSRLLQPKLYIFDDQWRVTATYPDGPVPANEDNPAVADIQVADLDGDGQSDILAGYNGIHGVVMLSPDGRRRWTNRKVFEVSRLAVASWGGKEPAIFVASFAAETAVLDGHGEERGRWPPESGPLSMLAAAGTSAAAASGSSPTPSLLGVVLANPNQFVVLGLAADGRPAWQYPLPPGIHNTQIQAVQWGRVVGDVEHWIVAAPDGSIHMMTADGTALDRFSLGAIPTGIAAATVDGQPALVVATKDGTVEAFRLEAAEAIRPAE